MFDKEHRVESSLKVLENDCSKGRGRGNRKGVKLEKVEGGRCASQIC